MNKLIILFLALFSFSVLADNPHHTYEPVPETVNIYNAVEAAVEACASGGHDFINSAKMQISIASCFKNDEGAYSIGGATLIDNILVKGFFTPSDSGHMYGVSGKWTFK